MVDPPTSMWRLQSRDGQLIAQLIVRSVGMPWIEANVVAGPVWDEYADLFTSEFQANERAIETDDWNEADRLYGKVRSATVLLNPDGIVVPEYLLHTDGTTARWRWHDEPFD